MSFFSTISSRQHYGLRLAIKLAQGYNNNSPVPLGEVATQERISLKYLEQLIVPFKKADLAKSVRGRRGGYVLLKHPDKITLKDIIWLLSDKPYLVSCLAERGRRCPLDERCLSKQVWSDVQIAVEKTLQKTTLGDLIKNQ